jgi:hypothetical protein
MASPPTAAATVSRKLPVPASLQPVTSKESGCAPSEIHAGMDAFRKAIDLDPTFALAYAAPAASTDACRSPPMPIRRTLFLATAAAQKALEIDDNLSR